MDEKHIFLDIACFFIGKNRDTAIRILDGSGWKGSLGFRSLQNKNLVEVDIVNEIRMHDHLRDLGRELAKDPRLPRRIWRTEDFDDLLQQSSVVTNVRGISMCWTKKYEDPSFSGCKMMNLQLLDIEYQPLETLENENKEPLQSIVNPADDPLERIVNAVQSPNLIWLRWKTSGNHSSLPSCIPMKRLRVLEVYGGNWETLWKEETQAPLQLREFQISSVAITSLPDSLGNMTKLQHISLSHLGHLERLPAHFENLTDLQHINLSYSPELKNLPNSFGNLINLQHIDLSYSGLYRLPDSFRNLAKLKYLDLSGCFNLTMSTQTLGKILRDVKDFKHGNGNGQQILAEWHRQKRQQILAEWHRQMGQRFGPFPFASFQASSGSSN